MGILFVKDKGGLYDLLGISLAYNTLSVWGKKKIFLIMFFSLLPNYLIIVIYIRKKKQTPITFYIYFRGSILHVLISHALYVLICKTLSSYFIFILCMFKKNLGYIMTRHMHVFVDAIRTKKRDKKITFITLKYETVGGQLYFV